MAGWLKLRRFAAGRFVNSTFDLVPSEFLDKRVGDKQVELDTFDYFEKKAVVELCEGITRQQLSACGIFRAWFTTLAVNLSMQGRAKHTFQNNPFKLQKIKIQSVDWRDNPTSEDPSHRRIIFLKVESFITNGTSTLPGIAFLRGGSVAMLIIVKPIDSGLERFVILTEQARIPAGSLRFKEIPAGMLDAESNIVGKAITEINEETGLVFDPSELIDLTELSMKESPETVEDRLQRAMYPSPGGSDEFISIFLCIKDMDRLEIFRLQDKLTGLRTRGELIKLSLCKYEDLWREGARDAKTLAAWTLYEGLLRSGALQRELDERKDRKVAALQDSRVPLKDDSDDD